MSSAFYQGNNPFGGFGIAPRELGVAVQRGATTGQGLVGAGVDYVSTTIADQLGIDSVNSSTGPSQAATMPGGPVMPPVVEPTASGGIGIGVAVVGVGLLAWLLLKK